MKMLYVTLLVMLVLALNAALGETIKTQAPAVRTSDLPRFHPLRDCTVS